MIPAAPFQDGPGEAARVVFFDENVDRGWIDEPGAIAETLLARAGYRTLDSQALDGWLAARIRGGADGTVLINLHGPSVNRAVELRAYMAAGGRLVWAGFPPSFLELQFIDLPTHDQTPVETTAEGVRWGYDRRGRGGHYGLSPADSAGAVLVRQGDLAVSFFLNPSPDKPHAGFLKLGSHGIAADWETLSEVIRVAEHGLGGAPPEQLDLLHEKEAPDFPSSEGGVFVSSGTFRLSREKALEKLQMFQLADPAMFLLPWARAAAAAGAKRVEMTRSFSSLVLEHDGASLAGERVEDPFGALFDPYVDPAAAQTAIGILGLLRARPSVVVVRSGGRRAEIRGPGDVRFSDEAGPHRLEVRWPLYAVRGHALLRRAVRRLLASHGDRFDLRLNGRPAPSSAPDRDPLPSRAFAKGEVRGELRGGKAGTFASRLEIRYLGVTCCEAAVWTWPCSMRGWLDADELTLSVSQSSVVRDEKFDALLKTLCDPGMELLRETAKEFGEIFPQVTRAMHERNYGWLWRKHNSYAHRRHPDDSVVDRAPVLFGTPTVERAARWAWWLRANAGAIPDAPLWMTSGGGALSTSDISKLAVQRGETLMTYRRDGGGQDRGTTVWLVSSGDVRQAESLGARPPRFV